MRENWVVLKDRKPEDGQTVLTFYYDKGFDIEQFEVMTYHKKGSVVGYKTVKCETPQESLIKNIVNPDEVIADTEGFYFCTFGKDGDVIFIKHADIITHWQPLVAPCQKGCV